MAVLSDLFNEIPLYSNIYAELKALFNQKLFTDHPINGYTIYMLLKCASVVELASFN
jgi:hypothetical protein